MAEKDIQLKQVLKRFPPGDRWTPSNSDQPIFSNLTEGIEWVFQQTKEHDYIKVKDHNSIKTVRNLHGMVLWVW